MIGRHKSGCTIRRATSPGSSMSRVIENPPKTVVPSPALEFRLLKKSMIADGEEDE
jgi:hypothetical protein